MATHLRFAAEIVDHLRFPCDPRVPQPVKHVEREDKRAANSLLVTGYWRPTAIGQHYLLKETILGGVRFLVCREYKIIYHILIVIIQLKIYLEENLILIVNEI